MNRKQKVAVAVGAVAVTLLVLFPPHTPVGGGPPARVDHPYVIFSWAFQQVAISVFPDDSDNNIFNLYEVNLALLLGLQVAAIALTVAGALLLADPKRKPVGEVFE